MSGFEWNKIAGAVLLAGLIAMVVGTVADSLYQPVLEPEKRGYEIAVASDVEETAGVTVKEEIIDVPTLLASADPESGKKVSKKCATCHSFDQGGPNKVGPGLWGIVGNSKAAHDGFTYSEALQTQSGKWDYDALFAFLKAPKKYVPGTKMAFAGISKPKDIADLVVYLRSLSSNPVALPTPAPAPTTAESAAGAEPAAEAPAPAAPAE